MKRRKLILKSQKNKKKKRLFLSQKIKQKEKMMKKKAAFQMIKERKLLIRLNR